MQNVQGNSWLLRLKDAPDEQVRLICIHHAGAAASFFRPWGLTLPPRVSLSAVQLPGREERRNEPFVKSMDVVLEHLTRAMEGLTGRPYAIFGHSLGGTIAYELTLRLEDARLRLPVVLGISATRSLTSPMGAPTYDQPDEAFLERIQAFGGTPGNVVAERELLKWILPRLRADTELHECTRVTRDRGLRVPLAFFYGADDPVCNRTEAEKWREFTTSEFESHGFSGGHFYLRENHRAILDVLLRRSLAAA